ncbi:MAG: hypothetical protein ACLSGB_00835 [Dorea sp.]
MPDYKEQAGKHDVIYIDFSEMPRECQKLSGIYRPGTERTLIRDIQEAYPELVIENLMRLSGIYYLMVFNQDRT